MEIDNQYFNEKREKTRIFFNSQKNIYNPYLESQILFTSDGFHHLQFSARRERNKKEQLLKFSLLPLAIKIIKKSGTLQEHRKIPIIITKTKRNGFSQIKLADFWGFVAIVGSKPQIKIKVILRRLGEGKIIFWSVMPFSKLKNGQKLYSNSLINDTDYLE